MCKINYLFLLLCFMTSLSLQAQWHPSGGPFGGNVHDLKSNTKYTFASTDNGMFRSTDAGQHWEQVNNGLPVNRLFGAYRCYVWDDTLLVLTLTHPGGMPESGIYKSVDNGAHWVKIPGPPGVSFFYDVHGNGNVVIMESGSGILYTLDNGVNWTDISVLSSTTDIWKENNTAQSRFFATDGKEVRISDAFGQNWAPYCVVNVNEPYFIDHFYTEGNLFFAHFYLGKTYRSTDGGQNWAPLSNIAQVYPYTRLNGSLYGIQGFNGRILRSDDDGFSWYPANPNPALKFRFLDVFKNSLLAGSGYSLGVFRSDDQGATLVSANRGFVASYAEMKVYEDTLYANTSTFLYKTPANAIAWDTVALFTSDLVGGGFDFAKIGNTLFVLTDNHKLLRSVDNGGHWTEIVVNNTLDLNQLSGGLEDIFLRRNNDGDTTLYHSADLGQTWDNIGESITAQIGVPLNNIFVFENKWYVSTQNGLYVSSDKGMSWTSESQGLPNFPFVEVKMYGSGDYQMLATITFESQWSIWGRRRLWVRHKNSPEWKESITGLTPLQDDYLLPILSFADAGGTLLLSLEDQGIFSSKDGGQSWALQEDGLPDGFGENGYGQVAVSTENAFLSIYRIGIWQRSVSELTTSAPEADELQVLDVYPNPNTGSFVINLPEPVASWAIYDALGRLSGEGTADGSKDLSIRMPALANGTYTILTRGGNGIWSGRFVVQH